MNIQFPFDSEKALETVLYVSDRVRNHDMYNTLKTIYLADKLHLERYGRLVFGDNYIAMEYGPVPEFTYDAVKCVDGRLPECDLNDAKNAFDVRNNKILRSREPDIDVFSLSELECLDEAIREYGHLSFGRIKDISHDEAYENTPRNGTISLEGIINTLPNAEKLLAYLADTHPSEVA